MKIWLDAQETRRTAEMALLDVQLNRADNLVTTYQALGGAPVLQAVPVGGPAR
jgi:outer membrane protein TolC